MKTRLLIIFGIIMIGISFYSIGPVLCDELFMNACYRIHHTEHFYTVLPLFIPLFAMGVVVILMRNKLKL